MSETLNERSVIKLYSLGTQIFSEVDVGIDLVDKLKNESPEEALNGLGKVDRHLLGQTIDELDIMEIGAIENNRFPVGGVDPNPLADVGDQVEYFSALLRGYPDPEDFVQRFASPFDIEEVVENGDFRTAVAGLTGSFSVESDPETKLQLFRFLAEDFVAIGEPISYGRLDLLNRYLPDLMRLEDMKRWDCLGNILERGYPFSDDNRYGTEGQDNWASEIRTLS